MPVLGRGGRVLVGGRSTELSDRFIRWTCWARSWPSQCGVIFELSFGFRDTHRWCVSALSSPVPTLLATAPEPVEVSSRCSACDRRQLVIGLPSRIPDSGSVVNLLWSSAGSDGVDSAVLNRFPGGDIPHEGMSGYGRADMQTS